MTYSRTMELSSILNIPKGIVHLLIWSWNLISRLLDGIFEISTPPSKHDFQDVGDFVSTVDSPSVTTFKEAEVVNTLELDSRINITLPIKMPLANLRHIASNSLDDTSEDRQCAHPTVAASVTDTESKATAGRAVQCPNPQVVQETVVKPTNKKQRKRKAQLEKSKTENAQEGQHLQKCIKDKDKQRTLIAPVQPSKVTADFSNKRYANSALRKLDWRNPAVEPVACAIKPIRQPLGPSLGSIGFSKEYQESRRARR